MRRISILVALILVTGSSFAQNFSRITIARDGNINFITFTLGPNMVMYVDKNGSIKKWGYDRFGARGQENYAEELDAYAGRVDYYSATDDPAYRGKIRYIGSLQLTYYASYDMEYLRGKLKSIGPASIEYYSSFDNASYSGNIRSIGQNSFTWYGSFDDPAYRGKLRSVDATDLTYYNAVEDKLYSGKIRSIGNTSYTWYGSFDLKDYRGAMKTGLQLQTINSIQFYVR